jgi:lysophospholipase L1-like esterase
LFARHGYLARGISGQTTAQMLERFDRDVIEVKPNVVVIFGGTNDIAGGDPPYDDAPIRANLRPMTERAQGYGIRVVLASLLPAREYPWRRGLDPARRSSPSTPGSRTMRPRAAPSLSTTSALWPTPATACASAWAKTACTRIWPAMR